MNSEVRTVWTRWLMVMVMMMVVMEGMALNGDNVCMVQQKYNITKRVKYRAPMSVRTYVWCFSMPPRCSTWRTEMRDLTRLENEERTAEVAVCCPGYKMQDISCVPICPNGKTGDGCTQDCPSKKWGPNCVHDCRKCDHGTCSPVTGECQCQKGWQGESCESIIPTTTSVMEEILTTNNMKTTLLLKPTAKTAFASATSTFIATSTAPTFSPNTVTEIPTSNAKPKTKATTEQPTSAMTTILTSVYLTTASPNLQKEMATNVLTSTVPKMSYLEPTTTAQYKKTTSLSSHIDLAPTTMRSPEIITKKYNHNQNVLNKTEVQMMMSTTTIDRTTQRITSTSPTTSVARITNNEERSPVLDINTSRKTTVITTTKKPETTISHSTQMKSKIKEIWIKPAQKGDATIEAKLKEDAQLHRLRSYNKKELTSTHTTPRTIVVSIIPTSSYSSFKKIALSTSSYIPLKSYNKSLAQNETSKISQITTTYVPLKNFTTFKINMSNRTNSYVTITTKTIINTTNSISSSLTSTLAPPTTLALLPKPTSKFIPTTLRTTIPAPTVNYINVSTNKTILDSPPTRNPHLKITKSISVTNSMPKSMTIARQFSKLTTASPTLSQPPISTTKHFENPSSIVTKLKVEQNVTINPTPSIVDNNNFNTINKTIMALKPILETNVTKRNETGTNTNTKTVTTVIPETNEEKFHVLTEPEPITDVMGDKGPRHTTVDLTSVISIAGGVMMVVITLAILLVMMERRRKPRYDDIRKMDEMRMQVFLDENNVPPPPYVRSIFHTPLPDPPIVEKCHYQPISTLNRNIKQFMRPVVVQTISPMMLENFRGILECHYDHLPLRNSLPIHPDDRLTPSIEEHDELICPRASSIAETAIEALKCEARQGIIDSSTSEPLYAEIPCWRPPSEHAVEVVNLNAEAVTEL